jgi:hypothetical protein
LIETGRDPVGATEILSRPGRQDGDFSAGGADSVNDLVQSAVAADDNE